MFYGDSPTAIRQQFLTSFNKHQNNQPLSALEAELVAVMIEHPEYHAELTSPHILDASYHPELGQTNPFLHMGLHLAIREQVATDRPTGIQALFKSHVQQSQEAHITEHAFMDCLAECLWLANKNQQPPDEIAYLALLQKL